MSTNGDENSANEPPEGSRGEAHGRARNPPASLPPLVLQMEDLTPWVMLRVTKFPRDHRFTLGDRLVEACLSVLDTLVNASFTRDELALLTHASRTLTRARTLVRLANRAALLSEKQRTYFAEQTDEIGRKLSGWTRSVRARWPLPRVRPSHVRRLGKLEPREPRRQLERQ